MNACSRPQRLLGLTISAVVAVALLVGCGSDGSSGGDAGATPSVSVSLPSTPMQSSDAAKLDNKIGTLYDSVASVIPQVYVGVWDPNKGVYTHVFDPSGKTGSIDDSVRIGSITKTFVATLILQLVAEGKLSLDDTVNEAAPKLAERYPAIADRTIRQLLAMRAGLPDFEKEITGRIGSDPTLMTKAWTADDLISDALDHGKVTAPNADPAVYSNTNYIVLGQVAEEVTGTSVADLVQSRLLEPLGLDHTEYPPADDTTLPSPASQGYVMDEDVDAFATHGGHVDGGTDVSDWTASWGGAAGIMSSTLPDLARWAAADFGSATLPADLQKERLDAITLDEAGKYGLGLMEFGPWIGHLGGIPGWSTLAMKNTETGVIAVIATTACCGANSGILPLGLLDQLYPGVLAPALR